MNRNDEGAHSKGIVHEAITRKGGGPIKAVMRVRGEILWERGDRKLTRRKPEVPIVYSLSKGDMDTMLQE